MMRLALGMLAVLAVGCATPYQSDGFSGGYADMRVADDAYQVSFRGNGYTSDVAVQQHWLHRCAELADEEGYAFFRVVTSGAKTDTVQDSSEFHCTGNAYLNTVDCSQSSGWRVSRHRISGTIQMLHVKPTGREVVYDTRMILGEFAH